MPTYEYECRTGGHRFEVKQSFSEPSLTQCQVCGEPVRKVFSAAGIVFKGSGYYVTDSRAGAKAANGSGDRGAKDKVDTDRGEKKDAKESTGASGSAAGEGSSSGSTDRASTGSSAAKSAKD